ncbi:hypothetical protein P9112_005324 [Eukaryota sp. TZLM1-RC]
MQLLEVLVYAYVFYEGTRLLSSSIQHLSAIWSSKFVGVILSPIISSIPLLTFVILPHFLLDEYDPHFSFALLSGSSIMLLTLSFTLVIWAGRQTVQYDFMSSRRTCISEECSGFSLGRRQGIEVHPSVRREVSFLFLSTLPQITYYIITKASMTSAHRSSSFFYVSIATVSLMLIYIIYSLLSRSTLLVLRVKELRERLLCSWVIKILSNTVKTMNADYESLNGSELAFHVGSQFGGQNLKSRSKSNRNLVIGSVTSEEVCCKIPVLKTFFFALLYLVIGVSIIVLSTKHLTELLTSFNNSFVLGFVFAPFFTSLAELISSLILANRKTITALTAAVSTLLKTILVNELLIFGIWIYMQYFTNVIVVDLGLVLWVLVAVKILVGGYLVVGGVLSMLGSLIVFFIYVCSLATVYFWN